MIKIPSTPNIEELEEHTLLTVPDHLRRDFLRLNVQTRPKWTKSEYATGRLAQATPSNAGSPTGQTTPAAATPPLTPHVDGQADQPRAGAPLFPDQSAQHQNAPQNSTQTTQQTAVQGQPPLTPSFDPKYLASQFSLPETTWADAIFLTKTQEGGQKFNGYVTLLPAMRQPGYSDELPGVTIATGFDLGHHNLADLNRMNLPTNLISRFTPYLGVLGVPAESLAKQKPLKITQQEAMLIDTLVFIDKMKLLARAYDRDTVKYNNVKFAQLPPSVQAVLFSVAYNSGHNFGTRKKGGAPDLWRQALQQDYPAMINNLLTWKATNRSDLERRRREEGQYLKKELGIVHP